MRKTVSFLAPNPMRTWNKNSRLSETYQTEEDSNTSHHDGSSPNFDAKFVDIIATTGWNCEKAANFRNILPTLSFTRRQPCQCEIRKSGKEFPSLQQRVWLASEKRELFFFQRFEDVFNTLYLSDWSLKVRRKLCRKNDFDDKCKA